MQNLHCIFIPTKSLTSDRALEILTGLETERQPVLKFLPQALRGS